MAGVAVALGLVMVLAGCDRPTQEVGVELAERPGLEQMLVRYEQMQQRIRDELDAEIGPLAWYELRNGAESNCSADSGGPEKRYMVPWGFDAGVSDADWPRAQEIIVAVIAEYGFTEPRLSINRSGRHLTTATDPTFGAFFRFGTEVNTSMQVTTGCHRQG